MQVKVLGCGEAFDDDLLTTSLLVQSSWTILMDCGYSMPPQLWRALPDHSAIDLIYITHAHADHYFGLPAVLARMWEEGRTTRLAILSQPPVLEQIRQLMEMAYAGLAARFQYAIEYLPADPAKPLQWRDVTFSFAPTRHSATNLAVRLYQQGKALCYSGDGMFTEESCRLFTDADLLVHEAYQFDASPVHADIPALVEMAERQDVRHLALVHVQRGVRRSSEDLGKLLRPNGRPKISMPEPLETFTL
jgi:ribonuclease BN (tRNA processing enzyme)